VKHLQLPGEILVSSGVGVGDEVGVGVGDAVGVGVGDAVSFVGTLPWCRPTLTEISFDDLPTELRMMALGLPVPEPNGWNVVLAAGNSAGRRER
jgi:hypothetical protein